MENSKIDKYIDYQILQNSNSNQAEVERLERLRNLLLDRQFIDAPNGLLTESEYNKWIKNAKKTFLLTIPTESLLMGDIHRYQKHSIEELNESVIGNLNSNQIIDILDSLNICTIMPLITNRGHARRIKDSYAIKTYGNIQLVGETENGNLISYPFHSFNRSISLEDCYSFRDGVRSINNINAYEVLFKYLKLPIATVLSSINEVNTHFPCNIPYDDELCTKIDKINHSYHEQNYLARKRY